jgi:protein-disulfide isomerase
MRFFKSTNNIILSVLALILVGLLGYYFIMVRTTTPDGTSGEATLTIRDQDYIRGNAQAAVTLVEFGDFQCPACGGYEPLVRAVVAKHAQNVRFVFKNFPLTQIHQNALIAAKYAEAAGMQGKFWEMHDILYDKQKEWSGALNAKELFVGYAASISGLDTTKLVSDAALSVVEDKIVADYKEGTRLGVQGTPTFFINGVKVSSNPSTEEAFSALLDAQIKK